MREMRNPAFNLVASDTQEAARRTRRSGRRGVEVRTDRQRYSLVKAMEDVVLE